VRRDPVRTKIRRRRTVEGGPSARPKTGSYTCGHPPGRYAAGVRNIPVIEEWAKPGSERWTMEQAAHQERTRREIVEKAVDPRAHFPEGFTTRHVEMFE